MTDSIVEPPSVAQPRPSVRRTSSDIEKVFGTQEVWLAIVLFCLTSFILFSTEAFERWYDFTRHHEDWELDEFFSILFAFLVTATILMVRHVSLLRALMDNQHRLSKQLAEQKAKEFRRKKMVALGDMAGGLAHEINNSLQPIIGLGGFVCDGLENAQNTKHLEYMKTMMGSARHAQGIIENMLIFAHEKSVVFERADGFKILEEAIQFSADILPSTLSVTTSGFLAADDDTTSEPAFIDCNKTGIFQVFYNLLKNAAHAMDGGGEINITVEKDIMPGTVRDPAIRIEIADAGRGISQHLIEKVFDPFFTTKDVSEGTGLGLATVHSIISQHGGQITMASILGVGTTFTLHLPIVDQSSDQRSVANV